MAHQKMTKAEKSWIVYDVGNSALVLLATSVIPIYFSSLAPEGGVVVAWSYAETVASLIIALLMPILGSIADMQGMKKKFIVGCVGTGVVATIAMGFVTAALAFLVVYVISSVALNSSMVFYDALLVDTTTDERMDEISSAGYAWGYIGSCVPFIACLGVVLGYETLGITLQTAMQIAFCITAAWWAVFTVPLLKNVQQLHFKPRAPHAVSRAVRGLAGTLREIWANHAIRYYMIAYFFYIDGVHTIIKLSTSYGTDLGIDSTQLVLALLVTQFVAFPHLRAPLVQVRHAPHAADCHRRVLWHHPVRSVLPALGHGVLVPGHPRGHVPGRHPGALAQRVWQALPQGARQRVLWVLRHLRQVRRDPGHLPRGHVHGAHRQLQHRRALHRGAVRRGLLRDAARPRAHGVSSAKNNGLVVVVSTVESDHSWPAIRGRR